ncbi:MAG TPA: hypothetical protein PLM81_12780 [Ginsengibacter sp.]|nr:hypothetical protein [Ginsengibacter sp.]HRP18159.1 hypothetical protein [Ginsengibacter sp.]HRP44661.1 hypothetical protein [Ginsengibacter sp.]
MIKRSIIILCLLLVFISLLSLLLPSAISVARSSVVFASEETISREINNPDNWSDWFPPLKEGLMTIRKISDDEAVLQKSADRSMTLKFDYKGVDSTVCTITPQSGDAVSYTFLQSPADGGVRVTLIANVKLAWYPWQRVRGVFMDKILGAQYDEALAGLKAGCERP